ncbi:uncharacterized protein LOC131992805 [Centropristis striata]|uniref:uncharacterized protein LOC131992805 n=1 Tax=Centropristis striata TaxID=184440 RepID=UPI0027E1B39B|nr:uncharacterized protein LOC131992805 [Centropristis striata]
MCHEVVETVCNMVLDDVTPVVYTRSICKPINFSVSMDGIEAPQREPNYDAVTEEDIQASLGHSLHQCLGEAFGVMEEMSEDSEQLLQLVAQEVAKKVNRTLAFISRSTSSNQSEETFECETPESPTQDMVNHVFKILQRCLEKKFLEFPDRGAPGEVLSLSPTPDKDYTEESSMKAAEDSLSLSEQQSIDLTIVRSLSPTSVKQEFLLGETTFLAVFLGKLLDHIAHSTKTSVLEMDFDGILKNLKKILGETSFPPPQTVGNLHLTIFKKLCVEFGSAKLLQTAIVSKGLVIEEVVAMELKRQLQKATCPSFATKVRRFFKRSSNKVSPASRVDTSVSHSEVIQLENGPTPLPQRKQKPAIIRMFCAMARILRKPFASCYSSRS